MNPESAQRVEGSQLWALSTSNEGGSAMQGGGGDGGNSGDNEVRLGQLLFSDCATMPWRHR